MWNATSQTFPTTINAPGSIFCSGNVHLPDGRILTAGGDGIFTTGNLGLADTTIFDPGDGDVEARRRHEPPALVPVAHRARRRPLRGHQRQLDQPTTWADTPEVYDPAADTWTLLTGVSTPQVHEEEYPFTLPRPERQGLHDRPVGGQLVLPRRRQPRRGRRSAAPSGMVNGSSVMYRPGQDPLQRRRAERHSHRRRAKAERGRHRPDRRARPTWRTDRPDAQRAHLPHADHAGRRHGARGRRRATRATSRSSRAACCTAEIWDPATETWTDVGADGGGPQLPLDRGAHARRPRPRRPAAATTTAARARASSRRSSTRRPTCSTARARRSPTLRRPATYGSNITVSTPDAASIRSVNLVSLGADTHQIDMDQHFVPLSFTAGSAR